MNPSGISFQEWEDIVNRECENAPLGEGTGQCLDANVQKIRGLIASQWARIIQLARDHGPNATVVKDHVTTMHRVLRKIMQEYCQVIPFGPDPNLDLVPYNSDVSSDQSVSVVTPGTTSSKSSSVSSSPGDDQIAFDMKFLQCHDDVWTVLHVICL